MTDKTTNAQTLERADVDAIWAAADPHLVDDLAQAVARGCVAYDTRLPPGCLTAVTKSVLVTLRLRRINADA